MGLLENIKLSISSLLANKLRSILTMLGIIIGISSVITIITIGDALTSSITGELAGFGARNISVYLDQKSYYTEDEDSNYIETDYVEPTEKDNITDEMLDEYEEIVGNEIDGVSVSDNIGSDSIANGKNKVNINIFGVNDGYFKVENITLLKGRFIKKNDVKELRNVAIVSDVFIQDYFGIDYTEDEVLGSSFQVTVGNNIVTLYICGVYQLDKDKSLDRNNYDITTNLYMPISLAKKISNGQEGYSSLTIRPTTEANVEELVNKTNSFFKEKYKRNENIIPIASSAEEMMKATNQILNSVKLAISSIAAISLLVGGIGVMNIMMVSITERTREIGIRKALGASKTIILIQFIVEAIIICVIGGIIGILSGISLGALGALFMGYTAKPNINAITSSVLFCMAIGVFFGYYPASKAAKLNPIDALRYE